MAKNFIKIEIEDDGNDAFHPEVGQDLVVSKKYDLMNLVNTAKEKMSLGDTEGSAIIHDINGNKVGSVSWCFKHDTTDFVKFDEVDDGY